MFVKVLSSGQLIYIHDLHLYIIIIARLSTSDVSAHITEDKMVAADENINNTPEQSLGNDPKKKHNHDCKSFKRKAQREIACLNLEIEMVNFRIEYIEHLINFFDSKLGDQM
ncbi:uncharacterized protein LOC107882795 [Acyrthosiphon pisum]|uniref:Uncharacterized protein n=1 Tax=Acyrthosiphon pisum TaxID=7029 RepID=A0A8R2D1V7_ACYPI|nr:uncharacterized protein LOC107882795 [Acyrthosiphon pisum]|eukprot:XP_016657200.1 PREDICTED: uncharacterized protein LOC107882795 [Acyrthosiphon pisum]